MAMVWKASYLIARDGSGIKFKTEANQALKWSIVGFVLLFFLLSNHDSFAGLIFFRIFVLFFSFLSMLIIGIRKVVTISNDDELVSIERTFFFFKKNRIYQISDISELLVSTVGKKEQLILALKNKTLLEVAIANQTESDNWQREIKELIVLR